MQFTISLVFFNLLTAFCFFSFFFLLNRCWFWILSFNSVFFFFVFVWLDENSCSIKLHCDWSILIFYVDMFKVFWRLYFFVYFKFTSQSKSHQDKSHFSPRLLKKNSTEQYCFWTEIFQPCKWFVKILKHIFKMMIETFNWDICKSICKKLEVPILLLSLLHVI